MSRRHVRIFDPPQIELRGDNSYPSDNMDKRFSSEIPLLSTNEVCDDNEKLNISSRKLATRYEPYRQQVLIAVSCIALASLSLNVVLILPQVSQTSSFSTLEGISAYTGLGLDVPSVHFHHTDYWSPNQTRADELWEGIDTNPMVVALTDEFADLHGLPHSDRFPWDKSKGRYFVKVFHQLHCLVGLCVVDHRSFVLTSTVEVY